MDSYLAPESLAAARRRANDMALRRCREFGVDPSRVDRAIVALRPEPFEGQRHLISTDTVCVTADVVLWDWDQRSRRGLADALRPDRLLIFVEPTADLGWRRAVHRLGRPAWRLGLGHDFEADIPAQLREAGLTVTTTDRFGFGPGEIHSYVLGDAQHFPSAP